MEERSFVSEQIDLRGGSAEPHNNILDLGNLAGVNLDYEEVPARRKFI